MARKFIVAGNWKMNGTMKTNESLVKTLNEGAIDFSKVDVVVVPPIPYVASVRSSIRKEISVGVQNCLDKASGAFTGEISPAMTKDIGASWAILGHSERRQFFHETNEIVAKKARFAVDNSLNVLACIGELLEQRENGTTFSVIEAQMKAIADAIAGEGDLKARWEKVVIAYEPVWAIGTGKVATPEQAQEVHAHIRTWLSKNVSQSISESVRVVYGGSVNGENCAQLAQKADIDGFLVGGASLKPEFVKICNARA